MNKFNHRFGSNCRKFIASELRKYTFIPDKKECLNGILNEQFARISLLCIFLLNPES